MFFLINLIRKTFQSGAYGVNHKKITTKSTFAEMSSVLAIFSSNVHNFLICLLIIEIRQRFKALNEALKRKNSILEVIFRAHLQLYDLVNEFNFIFGPTIMIFLAQIIIGSTFELFDIFSILSSQKISSNNIGYTLISLLWCLYINCFIIFFFSCCGMTLLEARNIQKILHRNLRFQNDIKAKNKLRIFAQQVKHAEVKFSCGIFDFNWTTIQTVSSLH